MHLDVLDAGSELHGEGPQLCLEVVRKLQHFVKILLHFFKVVSHLFEAILLLHFLFEMVETALVALDTSQPQNLPFQVLTLPW